jgi:hypothetical protein
MIIHIDKNRDIDTDRDLTSAERHVLQKLFGWKSMLDSVEQFRRKKEEALQIGWNNSGPIRESEAMAMVARQLEGEIRRRVKTTD